jgi:hypothetical protein
MGATGVSVGGASDALAAGIAGMSDAFGSLIIGVGAVFIVGLLRKRHQRTPATRASATHAKSVTRKARRYPFPSTDWFAICSGSLVKVFFSVMATSPL